VRTHAAVGVDDDLAAGQTAVALWAADNKSARRVDMNLGVVVEEFVRQRLHDDVVANFLSDFFDRNVLRMLARDDYGLDTSGPVALILDRHLRFSVRPQPVELTAAARGTEAPGELVSHDQRHRHQLGRLVGRVSEHQPLVTRTTGVHSLGDIRRLRIDRGNNGAGLVIEAELRPRIADLPDGFAHYCRKVDVGHGRDFTCDKSEARCDESLAGHSAVLVLGQHRVQNRVGDLICDLVRMTLGH